MKTRLAVMGGLLGACILFTACGDDECPDGRKGACGLAKSCVKCLTDADCLGGRLAQGLSARDSVCVYDSDCPFPGACLDGLCVMPAVCSLEGECVQVDPCHAEPGDPCGDRGVCSEGWCQDTCASDQDCQAGLGTCLPIGACSYQRCGADGTCPAGTEPVAGSLACAPVD